MTRQVALLRGINVGGHNRLPMARLRELMEGLGLRDVRTLLQSGNAVFTSALTAEESAAGLEAALASELGLTARVLVRTMEEVAGVVEANPLPEAAAEPARFLVLFLSAPPDLERLGDLDRAAYGPECVAVRGREIYVWCAVGIIESKALKVLTDRRLGVSVTARNWNTVTRLLDLA